MDATTTDYDEAKRLHLDMGGYLLVVGQSPERYCVTTAPESWGRSDAQIMYLDGKAEVCDWDETQVGSDYPEASA